MDLERGRRGIYFRHALRQAVGVRVLRGKLAGLALIEKLLGPRLHRHFARFETSRWVADLRRRLGPNAGQIRFTVRPPRRGRAQIRLAARESRYSRVGNLPLSDQRRAYHGHEKRIPHDRFGHSVACPPWVYCGLRRDYTRTSGDSYAGFSQVGTSQRAGDRPHPAVGGNMRVVCTCSIEMLLA